MSPFDITALNLPVRTSPLMAREGGNTPKPTSRDAAAPEANIRRDSVRVETTAMPANDAPIDVDRVAAIRNALREGTYPIQPAKIADAMIAGRLLLGFSQ